MARNVATQKSLAEAVTKVVDSLHNKYAGIKINSIYIFSQRLSGMQGEHKRAMDPTGWEQVNGRARLNFPGGALFNWLKMSCRFR